MSYYNEIDPKAVMWLRELLRAGLIPKGGVDERSIVNVQSHDLSGMEQCHFFAGIGGWAEALRLAGWPEDREVWTGSCPCQPFSTAGKGLGTKDERHLWPEFRRLIAECRPSIVFGEQVASKLGREWLSGVRADLEALGYVVGAADLCAASVGAPHIRQRLYWGAVRMADSEHDGGRTDIQRRETERRIVDRWSCGLEFSPCDGRGQRRAEPNRRGAVGGCGVDGVADTESQRRQPKSYELTGVLPGIKTQEQWVLSCSYNRDWSNSTPILCRDGKTRRIPTEPALFPLADGIPGRVGLLRGAGNAIAPQVAAIFIVSFMEAIHETAFNS